MLVIHSPLARPALTRHPRQLGLATGALPLLLSSAGLSYSQVGLFALCSYPYAAKLLWSPLVDAKFSKKLGRRKSWILPLQAALACLMLYLSMHVDACLTDVRERVWRWERAS
jgi:PAT family acetyl-CoA transporter-like MFS transporter 1